MPKILSYPKPTGWTPPFTISTIPPMEDLRLVLAIDPPVTILRPLMEAAKAMEEKARSEHENGTKTDLFKLMKKHDHDRLTSGIWERALEQDDKLAKRLFERAIAALGAGVGSAVNLLDPEAVIIGGGMGVRFGEAGVERIRAATIPHLFNDEEPPAIRVASLGDLGGAIGASLLVAGPPAS